MVTLNASDLIEIKRIYDVIKDKYGLKYGLDIQQINKHCVGRTLTLPQTINPVYKTLEERIPSRKNSGSRFYHYKSTEIAKQILQFQTIQASTASSNLENDFTEFAEFFRRTGAVYPFTSDNPIEKNSTFDAKGNRNIDNWKENIFLLCFTDDFKDDRFWIEYSGPWNQVCLEFEFTFPSDPEDHKFNFRNVSYDKGYDYDFALELNERLRKSLQIEFSPNGWTAFATHYKRAKYAWERETRLSFYYDNFTSLEAIYPAQTSGARRFISIDANSRLIKWKITNIICGPLVSQSDMNDLVHLGKVHNPSISVTRY